MVVVVMVVVVVVEVAVVVVIVVVVDVVLDVVVRVDDVVVEGQRFGPDMALEEYFLFLLDDLK